MNINFDLNEHKLVCLISGRIGTEMNEAFTNELLFKLSEYKNAMKEPDKIQVCIDLKDVHFVASSFIRTCLLVTRQISEGNFSIINASPMIKKTFKIAGLDEVLNVS